MSLLLDVKNLSTSFLIDGKRFRAVDKISYTMEPGQTLGLVGESGSGKSVSSLSLLRMIDKPGQIESGEIYFQGEDLLQKSEKEMRRIRGRKISMIFQEPMSSLNPVFTIGDQIAEVFLIHEKLSRSEALEKSIIMLRRVKMPAPEKRIHDYPHQLSGGMRQRVMIAIALACHPDLLIADEPTTALDLTIQAQILALMSELQEEFGMGILLITHDLGVVAETCDSVQVMYAGRIVEAGKVRELFTKPKHPYTQALLQSIPHLGAGRYKQRLPTIGGSPPSLTQVPKGCRFSDRCPFAEKICHEQEPTLELLPESRSVACHFHQRFS